MRMISAMGCLALGMLCFQTQAADQRKPDEKAAELVGVYQIVSGEKGGTKIPADHFKGVVVRIAKNAITTLDKDEKEVYAATYKLDTSKRPWRIELTATITPVDGKGTDGKEGTAEGLIQVDGETVKLIYALPQGEAPTEFKTHENQQMFILKKTSD